MSSKALTVWAGGGGVLEVLGASHVISFFLYMYTQYYLHLSVCVVGLSCLSSLSPLSRQLLICPLFLIKSPIQTKVLRRRRPTKPFSTLWDCNRESSTELRKRFVHSAFNEVHSFFLLFSASTILSSFLLSTPFLQFIRFLLFSPPSSNLSFIPATTRRKQHFWRRAAARPGYMSLIHLPGC